MQGMVSPGAAGPVAILGLPLLVPVYQFRSGPSDICTCADQEQPYEE